MKPLIHEIFEEGGRRCSSRFRECRIDFCECVCVLCLAESERGEKKEVILI